jgi:hypothetical protein
MDGWVLLFHVAVLLTSLAGLFLAAVVGTRVPTVRWLGLAIVSTGIACGGCLSFQQWAYVPTSYDDNVGGIGIFGIFVLVAGTVGPVHFGLFMWQVVCTARALREPVQQPPATGAPPSETATMDFSAFRRYPGQD